jgi:hypothetical protein
MISGAAGRASSVSPLVYVVRALSKRVESVASTDVMCQHILHYVHNSAPNVKVELLMTRCKYPRPLQVTHVYALSEWTMAEARAVDEQLTSVGNNMMLWHGTRAVNMLSILHSGLLPAPARVHLTGNLFGQVLISVI